MRLCGTVFSATLDMDTDITIVTPNRLRSGGYKVVYLLHGISGNSRTWLDYSMLPSYAAAGNSIYVMPEVGRSFYTDMAYGFKYFSYVIRELPEICASVFNISAAREDTAVIGASMGGYGALKCALTRPEQYGMCAAFSSCCLNLGDDIARMRADGAGPEIVDELGAQLACDLRSAFGDRVECGPQDDIAALAAAVPAEACPRLYLTCGTEDQFYSDHLRFCEKLRESGVEFEFEQWPARHDFDYFNAALKKAIDRFGL